VTNYKHYSFDLWLTLIKSNPEFKHTRSRIFHDKYNFTSKPLADIEQAFRQVDIMCNNINERTGQNIDAIEMYLMVISMINDYKVNLHDIDIEALYAEMETLVFEYLPKVYCEDTIQVLSAIRQRQCTANILSNTGFIKGITLRKVLQALRLDTYFDFQLYSDEVGMSKPNRSFFELMKTEAMSLNTLQPQQIIHIGDNPLADIAGASAAGIASFQIHSNNISITNLINNVAPNLLPA